MLPTRMQWGPQLFFFLPSPCFQQIGLHRYYLGDISEIFVIFVVSSLLVLPTDRQKEFSTNQCAWLASSRAEQKVLPPAGQGSGTAGHKFCELGN